MSSWTASLGSCDRCLGEISSHVSADGVWVRAHCLECGHEYSHECEGKKHAHPSMVISDCAAIAPIEQWWPPPQEKPRWPYGGASGEALKP